MSVLDLESKYFNQRGFAQFGENDRYLSYLKWKFS